MIRDVLVVIGACILSGLLAGCCGWLISESGDTQVIVGAMKMGQDVGEEEAADAWRALERSGTKITWLYTPSVVLLVGLFVGLVSQRRAWQLAVVGSAPFALVSVGMTFDPRHMGMLIAYLGVAAGAACLASRLRLDDKGHR